MIRQQHARKETIELTAINNTDYEPSYDEKIHIPRFFH